MTKGIACEYRSAPEPERRERPDDLAQAVGALSEKLVDGGGAALRSCGI
jgi:hypothetical protein